MHKVTGESFSERTVRTKKETTSKHTPYGKCLHTTYTPIGNGFSRMCYLHATKGWKERIVKVAS